MKKTYYLYVITSPSGKQYVGITGTSVKRRWKEHCDNAKEGRKYAICLAILKYGKDAFTIETLKKTNSSKRISNLEKIYIKKLNTLIPNGYNMTEGGLYEVSWTAEMLRKQSSMATKSNIERYKNPEERLKNKKIAESQWNDSEYVNKQLISRTRNLLKTSPVEKYKINNRGIHVKREDLCAKNPLPPFSKVRGILEHLVSLKNKGINVVGYTETSISMAGIGVAAIAKRLSMEAIIFDPQYIVTPEILTYHRKQWKLHSATIIPIKAGMAKVNWYISKNILKEKYGNKAVLLPLGLPFEHTIQATAKELKKAMKTLPKIDNVVVNIGSGTICAGVWKGLSEIKYNTTLYGILGRTSKLSDKRKLIAKKAKIIEEGLFINTSVNLVLIDEGWEYTEKSEIDCPFPSHPYYDLKAWQWLVENIQDIKGSVLFWNIGH